MAMLPGFMPRGEIAADDRARIAFGRVGVRGRERTRVAASDRGDILMTPVASIPKQEPMIWEHPQVMASLPRGPDDSARGRVSAHEDFLDQRGGE